MVDAFLYFWAHQAGMMDLAALPMPQHMTVTTTLNDIKFHLNYVSSYLLTIFAHLNRVLLNCSLLIAQLYICYYKQLSIKLCRTEQHHFKYDTIFVCSVEFHIFGTGYCLPPVGLERLSQEEDLYAMCPTWCQVQKDRTNSENTSCV